jgi:3-deoxy-manno-octulosonate cytidylyltransferase (CMP-KDO synthetase)
MSDVLVVIPARLQASRLPGKPLERIGGEAMIVQVWRRAVEADLGPVLVATDSLDIADAVEAAGGRALLTRSDHASGSDRVYEAVSKIDPEGAYQFVVNLQGDLPTLQPELLAACVTPLRQGDADIATLAAEIQDEAERDDPHVVKVIDGMRIDVALVDTVPLGVDTPADLERARALMAQQG